MFSDFTWKKNFCSWKLWGGGRGLTLFTDTFCEHVKFIPKEYLHLYEP